MVRLFKKYNNEFCCWFLIENIVNSIKYNYIVVMFDIFSDIYYYV